MANADFIKERVKEYYTENPIGSTAADAFAPWWMAKRFSLSPADANRQCADGPEGLGLDGFHIDTAQKPPALYLVKATLSENRAQIKEALAGLSNVFEEVSAILKGRAVDRGDTSNVLTRRAVSPRPTCSGRRF